ncbi:MAG: HIT family protein [Patescibacteria group bacterium]|nr:HIT family protein [Patescibacteria group bacterium]MCL5224357.1 HIT family protein [Patescibacteria group bacterium]
MEDCLFCKIARKEIPSEVVYEDEWSLGFLDLHPLSIGHTLVIPKQHAENIIDLPDELVGKLFGAVKLITEAMNNAFKPRGFTIGINHGRISGQLVDHLHVHIITRYDGDNGGSIHSVVKNPPREPLEQVRSELKKAVDSLQSKKNKE